MGALFTRWSAPLIPPVATLAMLAALRLTH